VSQSLVIETAESHPESTQITGEWILPSVSSSPGQAAETFPPPLHAWVPSTYAIVLGASQSPENEIDLGIWSARHAAADSVEAVRLCKRRGGGGAVLLGPHCLCLAVRLPRLQGLGPLEYFSRFNGCLIQGIADVTAVKLEPRGISDLAYADEAGVYRKVVGSSLYLTRDWALYLASVLITAPGPLFDALLKYPTREPDYRGGRNHRDFITDISSLRGKYTDPIVMVDPLSDRLRAFMQTKT
jgi:lipoate---protein ligase